MTLTRTIVLLVRVEHLHRKHVIRAREIYSIHCLFVDVERWDTFGQLILQCESTFSLSVQSGPFSIFLKALLSPVPDQREAQPPGRGWHSEAHALAFTLLTFPRV